MFYKMPDVIQTPWVCLFFDLLFVPMAVKVAYFNAANINMLHLVVHPTRQICIQCYQILQLMLQIQFETLKRSMSKH